MEARLEDIDLLKKLQEVDRARLKALTALQKLPQPEQGEKIREKMREIVEKLSQLYKLFEESKDNKQHHITEREKLTHKANELQESIEQAHGDYRKVTSLVRELEGIQKRQETLSYEEQLIDDRIKEIQDIIDTTVAAKEKLSLQEKQLAEQYREQGSMLKAIAEQAGLERISLISNLPEYIVQDYERILKKCGGVALCSLDHEKCSACRSTLDPGRVISLRGEAPLSHCPSCGRLMIIDKD